nr:MAG TPA: hypothetical protein [Caudoviricetes sp.]
MIIFQKTRVFQSILCPVVKWRTKIWLALRFYHYLMR